MRKKKIPSAGRKNKAAGVTIMLILMTSLGSCASTRHYRLEVNPEITRQTMEGFGASGAWWAQAVGGWENEENREQVLDLLFDKEKGIGLSLYRYNLGGGNSGGYILDPWRETKGLEGEILQFDKERDKEALLILEGAAARGVEAFAAFANSPPARLTVSGTTAGERKGQDNLVPGKEAEYARYLADSLLYIEEVVPLKFRYLSPINEPQWDWNPQKGQEGSHFSLEAVTAVLKALDQELKTRRLPWEIAAPEAGEWKTADTYAKAIFDDEDLEKSIPAFDGHSYWSSPQEKERFKAFMDKNYPGKKINMSEWCEMVEGRDETMESGLVLANTLHDDLVLLDAVTWQYWIAVSKYYYHDGLIYTNPGKEDVIETKRLWTLGNYSKFIRPGARRVETLIYPPQGGISSQPLKNKGSTPLKASAYKEENRLVLVLINNDKQENLLKLSLLKEEDTYAALDVYETSKTQNLTKIYSGKAHDDILLPPESLRTYVFY